jgi:multiple sugar transport system ATP-binding protein
LRAPSAARKGKTVAGISLKNLVKAFGAHTAVSGISLDVRDGEFLIMVGPSGCGKTTTLNMISGLEAPTSGEVMIGNRVVNDLDPGERGLGMVFQDLALFPHMTVFENIAFGLRVRKVSAAEIARRVTAAAEAMHITPLLDKLPRQCSGGESQRVALARTIVTNPAVFLMDEPLSSLDAKLRVDMRTELKRLHARLKATFIYVTHDQAEAMTMADRIVVMSKGVIEQLGTPLEIYNRPATQFVGGFFGTPTMNFLQGVLECGPAGPRFRGDGVEQALPHTLPAGLGGRNVVLGVRSEHVLINGASAAAGAPGTTRLLEPLGDVTLVHFDAGEGRSLVAKVAPGTALEPGSPLRFSFASEYCHLFDSADSRRI